MCGPADNNQLIALIGLSHVVSLLQLFMHAFGSLFCLFGYCVYARNFIKIISINFAEAFRVLVCAEMNSWKWFYFV